MFSCISNLALKVKYTFYSDALYIRLLQDRKDSVQLFFIVMTKQIYLYISLHVFRLFSFVHELLLCIHILTMNSKSIRPIQPLQLSIKYVMYKPVVIDRIAQTNNYKELISMTSLKLLLKSIQHIILYSLPL